MGGVNSVHHTLGREEPRPFRQQLSSMMDRLTDSVPSVPFSNGVSSLRSRELREARCIALVWQLIHLIGHRNAFRDDASCSLKDGRMYILLVQMRENMPC